MRRAVVVVAAVVVAAIAGGARLAAAQAVQPESPPTLIEPDPGRFGLNVFRLPDPPPTGGVSSEGAPPVFPLPLGAPQTIPRYGMPAAPAPAPSTAAPAAQPAPYLPGAPVPRGPEQQQSASSPSSSEAGASALAQTLAAADVSTRAILRDDVSPATRMRLADDVRRQLAVLPALTTGAGPLVDDARVRLAARSAALADAAERDALAAAARDILSDLDLLRRATIR